MPWRTMTFTGTENQRSLHFTKIPLQLKLQGGPTVTIREGARAALESTLRLSWEYSTTLRRSAESPRPDEELSN